MSNYSTLFNNFKNTIAKHYGNNPGKMLIHTGVIGWVLSAAAQVGAICTNDKLSTKQKLYLIPQELADAGVNIISFYLVTQTFKSVANKMVDSGKLLKGSVREFLKQNNVKNVGKSTFDVLKHGNLTPELAQEFKSFRSGIDFCATTAGSILSCNIITPIIRNKIATYKQKETIAKLNLQEDNSKRAEYPNNCYFGKPSFQAFQSNAYSIGSLKI